MKNFTAKKCNYSVLYYRDKSIEVFPYLVNTNGNKIIYSVSPLHGRSFVVSKRNGRYIISKGNGLSYTEYDFLFTGELSSSGDDTLGLLLLEDATRDFFVGQDIAKLGIKTNWMEYVIELNEKIILPNGHILNPILLQYSVECPYRICDAPFMDTKLIDNEVRKWENINTKKYSQKHLIAADVMIQNLRIMHDNNILHNAIHEQNYTWALELLDFELGRTQNYPYTKADYERHVPSLYHREIFQTYVIINYIAGVLRENINYNEVDNLFNKYNFNIEKYKLKENYYGEN